MTLDQLNINQRCRVCSLCECKEIKRRLLDLGFVEGSFVECVGKSPMGDPSAYMLRGTVIAIRKKDAKKIKVDLVGCGR